MASFQLPKKTHFFLFYLYIPNSIWLPFPYSDFRRMHWIGIRFKFILSFIECVNGIVSFSYAAFWLYVNALQQPLTRFLWVYPAEMMQLHTTSLLHTHSTTHLHTTTSVTIPFDDKQTLANFVHIILMPNVYFTDQSIHHEFFLSQKVNKYFCHSFFFLFGWNAAARLLYQFWIGKCVPFALLHTVSIGEHIEKTLFPKG